VTAQPTLHAARLVLRPFAWSDARDVQRLAGAPEVAATTLNIPHPYEDGMAEAWIATHAPKFEQGVVFAITLDGALVGAAGLVIEPPHRRAELGYWIGVPYWNRGIATEAAAALLDWGFGTLGLHKVVARHLPRNPASGRVMHKLGMTLEGRQREHVWKRDRFEDLLEYAILASEWRGSRRDA
jgi:[ribosomal protein S5]-alanine N-acetyltransferase